MKPVFLTHRFMRWPISLWLAPHCDTRQFLRLSGALIAVPKYLKGASIERLRQRLSDRFGGVVFLFAMGRHALFTVVRCLLEDDAQERTEVIVCGYTCASVFKTLSAAGAKVVFADVHPGSLGLDIDSVRRCMTPRTRAVICQHTFGLDGNARALKKLCEENHIALIEDCAHCCPDETGPAHLGSFGDVTLFSFGREKPFCGVSGGAIICRDSNLARKIEEKLQQSHPLTRRYIFLIQLFPFLQVLARPLYTVGLGERFLAWCDRLKLSFKQLPESGWGPVQHDAVHSMPNIYAYMVLDQWDMLQEMNDHRRALVRTYIHAATKNGWRVPSGVSGELPLQHFPVFLKDADAVRSRLRSMNIHLDNGVWDSLVFVPADSRVSSHVLQEDLRTKSGSLGILFLPTHITTSLDQARTVIEILSRETSHKDPGPHA